MKLDLEKMKQEILQSLEETSSETFKRRMDAIMKKRRQADRKAGFLVVESNDDFFTEELNHLSLVYRRPYNIVPGVKYQSNPEIIFTNYSSITKMAQA